MWIPASDACRNRPRAARTWRFAEERRGENRKANERSFGLNHPVPPETEAPHWTARHGKPIIFVIVTMVAVGIYLALTIPVAVFPDTNFPRIVVGVDNNVAPIDQMQVMVTKPIEEAAATPVQGLDHLWSITSRGTAEIDLFFNWNVDMYRTLELVNAALARVQSTLPSTAKITANRADFRCVPDHGVQPHFRYGSPDHAMGDGELRPKASAEPADLASRRWWSRAAKSRNSRYSPTLQSSSRPASRFRIFWTPSHEAT